MGAPKKQFGDHLARLDRSDPAACWLWPGGDNGDGYGQLTSNMVHHRAHRYFYEHMVGEIPNGMVLDHTCHDPETCSGGRTCLHRKCCNPAHMAVVTNRENLLRGGTVAAENSQKTHCIHGHEFTPENTYRRGQDGRECRTCMRNRAKAQYHRKKAAA